MKRKITLTESELVNLVKRIINENPTTTGPITPQQIAQQIKQAVDNEDINALKRAIYQIRNNKFRQQVASILKSHSIMAYIGEEMKTTTFWTGSQNSYAKGLVEIGNYLSNLATEEKGDFGLIYRDHKGFLPTLIPGAFDQERDYGF